MASEFSDVHQLFGQAQPVLQRFPNVVSVGVGTRQRKGRRTGEPCFVVGVTRKTERVKRPLPKKLLGVRVDVQVVRRPKTMVALGAGGECRSQGRDEQGQIGMLASLGGSPVALTALHVLLTERVSIDVATSDFKNTVVEGRNLGDDFTPIGRLVQGSFSTHEDIACIRLNSTVDPSPLVVGASTRLKAPVALVTDLLATDIQFEVPGDVDGEGVLLEFPVAGAFDTASGQSTFHNLAKFEIRGPGIRPGWSGSALFTSQGEPLTFISFGSSASADGSVPAFAYGFPLAPHWEGWGLSTL